MGRENTGVAGRPECERIHPAPSFQLGMVSKGWHVCWHRLIAASLVFSCKFAVLFSIFYVGTKPAFSWQRRLLWPNSQKIVSRDSVEEQSWLSWSQNRL